MVYFIYKEQYEGENSEVKNVLKKENRISMFLINYETWSRENAVEDIYNQWIHTLTEQEKSEIDFDFCKKVCETIKDFKELTNERISGEVGAFYEKRM